MPCSSVLVERNQSIERKGECMANICNQDLYIFADTDDDMKALLRVMAEHFKTVTDIDCISGVDASDNWLSIADSMKRASENYNMLCFLADEPDVRAESGEFERGMAFGKPYVALIMGLKWGPSHQVAEFCNSLDSSKYGCATINGGEYMCAMGDETAMIQWGEELASPFDGGLDCEDFVAWSKEIKAQTPVTLQDMALRQLFQEESANSFFWSLLDGGDEFGGNYDTDYEPWNTWDKPPVNWANPSTDDAKKIVSAVLDVAAGLPLIAGIGYGYTKEGNDAVEALLPGDVVSVSGEWNETDFSALKVSTTDGTQIGYVSGWIRVVEDYDINRIALGVLSLMLPHTRATVCELTPVSLRNTGAEGPNMSIRLDMEEVDFAKLREEVCAMVEKPCSERALSSGVKGAL